METLARKEWNDVACLVGPRRALASPGGHFLASKGRGRLPGLAREDGNPPAPQWPHGNGDKMIKAQTLPGVAVLTMPRRSGKTTWALAQATLLAVPLVVANSDTAKRLQGRRPDLTVLPLSKAVKAAPPFAVYDSTDHVCGPGIWVKTVED